MPSVFFFFASISPFGHLQSDHSKQVETLREGVQLTPVLFFGRNDEATHYRKSAERKRQKVAAQARFEAFLVGLRGVSEVYTLCVLGYDTEGYFPFKKLAFLER